MRKLFIITAICGGLLAGPAVRTAPALPHGCVSASRDFAIDADAFRRTVGVNVLKNQPCSFTYAAGDTYSGSGRFSVSCSTGGYFFHPDYREDREVQPDVNMPIPQPCAVGATVTIDGFNAAAGGGVIAGGPGTVSVGWLRLRQMADANDDFSKLCDNRPAPAASVTLTEPVNNSGIMGFGGTVHCRGASVDITSVRVVGLAGTPPPVYAGTASCRVCRGPISASGTIPARTTTFDVEMHFTASRPGKSTVRGYKLGRYVVGWGGHVTTIYPTPHDNTLAM